MRFKNRCSNIWVSNLQLEPFISCVWLIVKSQVFTKGIKYWSKRAFKYPTVRYYDSKITVILRWPLI